MRARPFVRPLSIGLSLVTALSCGEPTAPLDTGGTYALVRIAGEALPAPSFESEFVRVASVADTLRFYPDGTGSSPVVQRAELPPARTPDTMRIASPSHYT